MKFIDTSVLLALFAIQTASHAIVVSTESVADNVAWTQTPSYTIAGSSNLYDSRALSIQDAGGLTVESVRIRLDTTGTFDDSLAMDIDADGIIDFVSTQDDAYDTAEIGQGVYTPWVDASPYVLDAIITQTGTTLVTYWNGVEINVGEGSPDTGFNTTSSFTLEDWGFGADGTIIGDDFTTQEIWLGSINTDGPENHDISFTFDAVVIRDTSGNQYIFDPDGDGVPSSVPEPSSSALLIALGIGSMTVLRRKHR
jgi:hypothetical protein